MRKPGRVRRHNDFTPARARRGPRAPALVRRAETIDIRPDTEHRVLHGFIMFRMIPILALGMLVALAAILLIRTMRLSSRQVSPASIQLPEIDTIAVAEHLLAAIQIPTISHEQASQTDTTQLLALHRFLESAFPLVHARLRRDVIGDYSLLYTWTGTDPTLEPVVLAAHLDVVPAPEESLLDWSHPPFEGHIVGGFVWGRGALDDKNALIGLLEAVELLLAEDFQPRRTVMLAFGHDEEQGGYAGARAIAEFLATRGIRAHFVLDEGLFVTNDIIPGIKRPVALIGMAEKGQVSLELSVDQSGGHASIPPRASAIGLLAGAIVRLETQPFPGRIRGLTAEMFRYLAPEMGLGARVAFANLWLFEPLVRRQLAARPATAASLRTTTAPTIVEGGEKANVLARSARAVLNFRIHPAEHVADVVNRVRDVVDDERVRIRVLEGASEPTPVSPSSSAAFQEFQALVRVVFPEAVVAPALMIARSDARHYHAISDHVYRFSPVRMRPEDLERLHGVDERISLESLRESVRFYVGLMKQV